MTEPWTLYEKHAGLWVELRRPGVELEAAWLDKFCASLPAGSPLLDLGCGHGDPIGRELLERGYQVWGIDRAAPLIEVAQSNLPHGCWSVGDMSSFDVDGVFSGIVMWHSLFHLPPPEQRAVFHRVAAHTEAGSMLMFTSGTEAGTASGEFAGESLAHYSLDVAEYEELLTTYGFEVVEFRESDPGCGHANIWLTQRALSDESQSQET